MKIWWLNSSTANWKVLAAGYSQIVKYVFEPSVWNIFKLINVKIWQKVRMVKYRWKKSEFPSTFPLWSQYSISLSDAHFSFQVVMFVIWQFSVLNCHLLVKVGRLFSFVCPINLVLLYHYKSCSSVSLIGPQYILFLGLESLNLILGNSRKIKKKNW